MIHFGAGLISSGKTWAELKAIVSDRKLSLQYDESVTEYSVFAVDDILVFHTTIFKGTIPTVCDATQEENDFAKADFEANYKAGANLPLVKKIDNTPLMLLDSPMEADKKPVTVNSPATEGTFTWLTSCGDDLNPTPPSSGRGEGQQLFLNFIGADTKEVEIQFCEPVELHDGHVSWKGEWSFEDHWSISVRMPATVVSPNTGNIGNCNLVDTGMGFHMIVPATGDGTHDVDFNQAVPIPDGFDVKTQQGQGFWNIDRHWSEAITPKYDAKGEFNLYDIALEMFFCKRVDCGNPLGIWDLDAYKAEWVSKKWKLCFQVTKVTDGAGKIGGYLMIFRPGAT